MSDFMSNGYFDVFIGGVIMGLTGKFVSVSGLGMEFEYETYSEGGSMYPYHFLTNVVPQTLVLEQGTVTDFDAFALWLHSLNLGMKLPLPGIVMLNDPLGSPVRTWMITNAVVTKYIGPDLNSNSPQLAVSRIELMHNGCI